MKPIRLPGPSETPSYAIRWPFTISGYAQAICDRITRAQLWVPANDTDRFRW